jgi:hypothetical protein
MPGVTILIPKNTNTERPRNFWPLTCLPTVDKANPSIISKRKHKYTDDKNLITREENGCCRGSK